jgi:GLPGLI family protein
MKTFLLLAFILIVSRQSYCQSAIEIEYYREGLHYLDRDIAVDARMVFNDSFALVYCYTGSLNKHLPKKQVGDKLIHHAIFYNFITNEKLKEVNWPVGQKYLVRDTVEVLNWQFFNNKKKILSKTCAMALSVNQVNDSILVWYTKDLLFQKGPLFYDHIPGVVLEVFDQELNEHIIATKIVDRRIALLAPVEGTKISLSEFRQMREVKGPTSQKPQ